MNQNDSFFIKLDKSMRFFLLFIPYERGFDIQNNEKK